MLERVGIATIAFYNQHLHCTQIQADVYCPFPFAVLTNLLDSFQGFFLFVCFSGEECGSV